MYEVPVIAVLGHKDSGKTTVMEALIRRMVEEGYRVAAVKHISRKGFSLDQKGKDTWRHSIAGANPVISVSDKEMAIIIRDGVRGFSLNRLSRFISEADVLLLEGFSWISRDDEEIGKIICVRSDEEYEYYKKEVKGETLAFCSFDPPSKEILDLKKESSVIAELALEFVERKRKIEEILNQLPGLNCGKCGYSSCEEMARKIYEGNANLEDCRVLEARSKLKTRITIDGLEVPIQPFVSKIIYNSVMGMVSSLKGVTRKGDERIHIEISS